MIETDFFLIIKAIKVTHYEILISNDYGLHAELLIKGGFS